MKSILAVLVLLLVAGCGRVTSPSVEAHNVKPGRVAMPNPLIDPGEEPPPPGGTQQGQAWYHTKGTVTDGSNFGILSWADTTSYGREVFWCFTNSDAWVIVNTALQSGDFSMVRDVQPYSGFGPPASDTGDGGGTWGTGGPLPGAPPWAQGVFVTGTAFAQFFGVPENAAYVVGFAMTIQAAKLLGLTPPGEN